MYLHVKENMLWTRYTFGPVLSRRLGNSLGLNVLPQRKKICNFNCIYCECGLNDKYATKYPLPSVSEYTDELEATLSQLKTDGRALDHLTFAGNGEPTLHPQFLEIVESTCALRSKYYPEAEIAVLTDAVHADSENTYRALQLVEKPIMKIDAGSEEMFQRIDRPEKRIGLHDILMGLQRFEGNFIVQTLFLRGTVDGQIIDNTSEEELDLLLQHYRTLKPRFVMVYSFDRPAPIPGLEKIPSSELEAITNRINAAGIPARCYP